MESSRPAKGSDQIGLKLGAIEMEHSSRPAIRVHPTISAR